MTTLTRFVPFRSPLADVAVLQNRLNSIFNDFASSDSEQESLAMGNFVPPVDVYEDAHQLVLKLEVPGIKQEDLDVQLENQTLTVKGQRKFEKDEKEENFRRVERRYGSFSRSFTLPNAVNTDDIHADYNNGVLNIRLAKRAEAKPKQIKVNVGSQKSIEGKKPESQTQTQAKRQVA